MLEMKVTQKKKSLGFRPAAVMPERIQITEDTFDDSNEDAPVPTKKLYKYINTITQL